MKCWRQVTRQEPCPICAKGDWCSRSIDNAWIACRRLDSGEGIHRLDKAGIDYWLYRLDGTLCHDEAALERPCGYTSAAAPPDALHQVYRCLLKALSLTSRHRQHLCQRGLSDDEITRRRYRSLPSQGRAEFARHLVDRFGSKVCAQVPGLYIREEEGRRWWSLAGASGLLIPVRDLAHRIMALTVRSDDPDTDPRYSAVSSKKHGGPGPGTPSTSPCFRGVSLSV